MILRIVAFLIVNFGALAIGGIFTNKGVNSNWYQELSKAPWTPPGWFFGFAWTAIMICFSLYMAFLWPKVDSKKLLLWLFALQWILNLGWNPVFFYFQNVSLGLVVILSLTFLIGYFLIKNWNTLEYTSILIAPYFLWLLVASSLNAYILLKN